MKIIKNIVEIYSENIQILIITIILIILCILLKIYYPKFRGFMGEFWVKLKLKKLPKNKYINLNNIMLQDNNGIHQIDHIVLSNHSIFVIETKNYYGLIKGKEFDNKWCQYLGKTKNYFQNPINQNYGHIKALANLLNLDEKHFISLICFSNQAKLDIDSKTIVTHLDDLNTIILQYKEVDKKLDIEKNKKLILSANINDKKMRKEHVKDIRSKIILNKELENKFICPRCGGELIEKNSKYGTFIGCSNFPKCRYIKK